MKVRSFRTKIEIDINSVDDFGEFIKKIIYDNNGIIEIFLTKEQLLSLNNCFSFKEWKECKEWKER